MADTNDAEVFGVVWAVFSTDMTHSKCRTEILDGLLTFDFTIYAIQAARLIVLVPAQPATTASERRIIQVYSSYAGG